MRHLLCATLSLRVKSVDRVLVNENQVHDHLDRIACNGSLLPLHYLKLTGGQCFVEHPEMD